MVDQLTVKFIDVQDQYPCNEDIECKYFSNNYKICEGDRIAIFKMGWNSLKNYILFEWAIGCAPNEANKVVFSKFDLPNTPSDADDLYQFCYISGENIVQGISTPFQIYSAHSKSLKNLTDSIKNENQCTHLKQLLTVKDHEILKLKEENAMLKESLKALVDQRKFTNFKSYDGDINELREAVSNMRGALLGQQKEIDSLKMQIKKDKAEYKNLRLEKILADKKYEAISSKKEATNVKTCNMDFDLGSLPALPDFPFKLT